MLRAPPDSVMPRSAPYRKAHGHTNWHTMRPWHPFDGLQAVRARAFLKLIADAGLGPLIGGMEMDNDGKTVSTRFLSSVFEVLTPNANSGIEFRSGYLRVWNGNVQRILGNGFGAAGEGLMDYFGPNVGAANASKANAVMWMDASGAFTFNGSVPGGFRTRVGNEGVFVYYPNGVAAVELGVLP